MTGPDRPLLEGMLAWQRSTLLNICEGLSAEQLAQRPIPSSNLSLLGLVRHMAKVERVWFRKRAATEDIAPPHNFEARDNTDFNVIDANDAADEAAQLQREQVAAARAVSELDFDLIIRSAREDMSLRMIHLHMIQEYARHNGRWDREPEMARPQHALRPSRARHCVVRRLSAHLQPR